MRRKAGKETGKDRQPITISWYVDSWAAFLESAGGIVKDSVVVTSYRQYGFSR
jgi:hypothetical protein